MQWSGALEYYVDFKKSMLEMLCYDIQGLNLSTLKAQIVAKDKSTILDYLYNVEDIEKVFEIFDVHFGSIRTIILKLKRQMNAMKNFPKNREEENSKTQKMLNFYKIMKSHGTHISAVNYEFIQEMSN